VYAPVVLFSFIVILLVVLMLIGVLAPGLTGMAEFASAMADVVLIMFMIPLIILMLIGPLLLFALLNNSRNRRKAGKPRFDQGGSFQVLLWKLDNLIQRSQTKTNEIAPKMADQVVRFNELLAYTEAFLKQIFSYFKRS
jgi:amino acid transporter